MTWYWRWLIVGVVFWLAWKGITAFCCYWALREQERMASRPQAPGLKREHRRVS